MTGSNFAAFAFAGSGGTALTGYAGFDGFNGQGYAGSCFGPAPGGTVCGAGAAGGPGRPERTLARVAMAETLTAG